MRPTMLLACVATHITKWWGDAAAITASWVAQAHVRSTEWHSNQAAITPQQTKARAVGSPLQPHLKYTFIPVKVLAELFVFFSSCVAACRLFWT